MLLKHLAAKHLAEKPVPKDRFLDLIRADRTIPEPTRQRGS
jgi:hypothetical protein